MNRLQFTEYLRHTLIPDFRDADMDPTAADFETALQFIHADTAALQDARKALLAASTHLRPETNASALVAASVRQIEGILGYPVPVTPAATPARSHRSLDSVSKLHD